MAALRTDRRLAAVLTADVVGYARLTRADERGAIRRLKAVRKELIEPAIAGHGGRIVKLMGDGALVEFPSVVGAVETAVEIQRAMAQRDLDRPEDERIRFRIGIHVGDVIADGRDILGDDVNVAARLEGLAEPGGICVSAIVREQVRDRLPYPFEDRGEKTVKSIARPVHVYALPAAALTTLPPREPAAAAVAHRWLPGRRPLFLAVTCAGVLAASAAAWRLERPPPAVPAAPATILPPGSPTAPVPAPRLSIAVLPFANLGGDPEQEYFADGITDDLITDLARIDGSFVIASSTAFAYKGRPSDPKQVGRELGVRYVLTGSLRRAGSQVRVNVQLIDAATGGEVWADRIEGDWTRSMELQDAITGRLARTLDLELTDAESRRVAAERPNDPDAVDLAMRAWSVLNQPLSAEQLQRAQDLFEAALRIDPGLSQALVGLARTLSTRVNSRWSPTPKEDLDRAEALVAQVLARAPNHAMAHYVRGDILMARKDFDPAIAEYQAAIASNRDLAPAYGNIGRALVRAGRAEEAFAPLETALRLSPRDPLLSLWYFGICHAHTHLAQDEAAIAWCSRSNYWVAYVDLASAYAWTGRMDEARAAVAELRRVMPGYTVERWQHEGWSDNPVFLAQYQRIVEGLRKAGLPER
ncbi:adenylate/guanylate cyclase domain-containing protein [Benzoatithermus flavus]|uniref:Tetratricopeptide repeat protein n=1 Tax=Benzoatithermus flavus TaxID=3108223 RepID=A0ABU8XRW6_9PROT